MYKTVWNAAHPGHVCFLLDLSGAMEADNKIDNVINALQDILSDICSHCFVPVCKNNGPFVEIRERVSVSIYGYNYQVKCLGNIKNWGPKEIGPFIKNARKDGRPIFDKYGEAKPEGYRAMRFAFYEAKHDIEQWITKQTSLEVPSPIVINITAGCPFEVNTNQNDVFEKTLRAAKEIMKISTSDGPVRIFNIHYSPSDNMAPLRFPRTEPSDPVSGFLFNASSQVTDDMAKVLSNYIPEVTERARTMISNEKDVDNLIAFISNVSTLGMNH